MHYDQTSKYVKTRKFFVFARLCACERVNKYDFRLTSIYIYGTVAKHFLKIHFQRGIKKPKAKLLLIYLSLGMVSTSRSVDNYVRQNQSDGALPQISGIIIF